ncbi:hypothetical protein EXS73_01960 [Candidatus Pacearchaeota archaeon]|nr:hypothetical protein [Candidatus Pacearchaeota archaeon]
MKQSIAPEKILDLLFKYPNTTFSLRELSKKLSLSPPAIGDALKVLEKQELITLEKRFNYLVRGNITDTFTIKKRIANFTSMYTSGLIAYLNNTYPLATIILFGSYAYGQDAERSDIDIAIIDTKEKPLNLEPYEKECARPINIEYLPWKKISPELKNSVINGILFQGAIEL